MAVSNEDNLKRVHGAGTTPTIGFLFRVLQSSDLKVYKILLSTGVAVLQTEGVDYDVELEDDGEGGNVVFLASVSALYDILIVNQLELVQTAELPTEGNFNETAVETALDRCVLINIQQQEQINRSLKLTQEDPLNDGTFDGFFIAAEDAADRALKVLIFNEDGDGVESGPDTTDISTVADNIAAIDTVSDNIASVNTCATNIADIINAAGLVAGAGSLGLIAHTGAGTSSARTLTGTAAQITVTNGNGVSGNPTLSLPATITLTGKTIFGGIYVPTTMDCYDTAFVLLDDLDDLKQAKFQCSGITSGNIRTMTIPDKSGTLMMTSDAFVATDSVMLAASGYGGTITSDGGSAIISGSSHVVTGFESGIFVGDNHDVVGDYSAIAGGSGNDITGNYCFIGGSDGSAITGDYNGVVGGFNNDITTSNQGFIGGGSSNDLTDSEDSAIIGGAQHSLTGGSFGSVIIGGYFNNLIGSSDSIGGTIMLGGDHHSLVNCYNAIMAGGDHHTMSGADVSVIIGGDHHTLTNSTGGTGHAILGGDHNTISGTSYGNVVLGGGNNSVTGDATYSGILAGERSSITANNAAVLAGKYATARDDGSVAQGGGRFAATGDAQRTVRVFRGQTTNNTPLEIKYDASGMGLTIPSDTSMAVEVVVVARRTDADNESAAYKFFGCIDNNGGMTALVGAVVAEQTIEDTAAWAVAVAASDAGDRLVVTVTGENAKTINWVASVVATEVKG